MAVSAAVGPTRKLAILESWRLAGQGVKGAKAPAASPTRKLTLSSKDNISRRPGPLKVLYQAVIRTPHFYFVKLTILA